VHSGGQKAGALCMECATQNTQKHSIIPHALKPLSDPSMRPPVCHSLCPEGRFSTIPLPPTQMSLTLALSLTGSAPLRFKVTRRSGKKRKKGEKRGEKRGKERGIICSVYSRMKNTPTPAINTSTEWRIIRLPAQRKRKEFVCFCVE